MNFLLRTNELINDNYLCIDTKTQVSQSLEFDVDICLDNLLLIVLPIEWLREMRETI